MKIGIPLEFKGDVISAQISDDGLHVFAVGHDARALVWERRSIESDRFYLSHVLKWHTTRINSLDLSINGRHLATAGNDGGVVVWNLDMVFGKHRVFDHGRDPEFDKGKPVYAVEYHEPTRQVLMAGTNGAQIWNADDGSLVRKFPATFEHPPGEFWRCAWSGDGKNILLGSRAGRVFFWPLEGSPVELSAHGEQIESLDFGPGGYFVSTSGKGDDIDPKNSSGSRKVWKLGEEKPIKEFDDGRVSFNADFLPGQRAIVAMTVFGPENGSGKVELYDCNNDSVIEIPLHERDPRWVAFSDDGQYLLITTGTLARVWKVSDLLGDSPDSAAPLPGTIRHLNYVYRAFFGKDSYRIVTVSRDQTAKVAIIKDGQLDQIGQTQIHDMEVYWADFHPNRPLLVTASNDSTAQIWDYERSLPVGPPLLHNDGVYVARFIDGGARILTSSRDGSVRIWPTPELPDHEKGRDWLKKSIELRTAQTFDPKLGRVRYLKQNELADRWNWLEANGDCKLCDLGERQAVRE